MEGLQQTPLRGDEEVDFPRRPQGIEGPLTRPTSTLDELTGFGLPPERRSPDRDQGYEVPTDSLVEPVTQSSVLVDSYLPSVVQEINMAGEPAAYQSTTNRERYRAGTATTRGWF